MVTNALPSDFCNGASTVDRLVAVSIPLVLHGVTWRVERGVFIDNQSSSQGRPAIRFGVCSDTCPDLSGLILTGKGDIRCVIEVVSSI